MKSAGGIVQNTNVYWPYSIPVKIFYFFFILKRLPFYNVVSVNSELSLVCAVCQVG